LIAGVNFGSFMTPDTASRTMPDMASGYHNTEQINAMSGSFFDFMFGVKKQARCAVINCPTSANEA